MKHSRGKLGKTIKKEAKKAQDKILKEIREATELIKLKPTKQVEKQAS